MSKPHGPWPISAPPRPRRGSVLARTPLLWLRGAGLACGVMVLGSGALPGLLPTPAQAQQNNFATTPAPPISNVPDDRLRQAIDRCIGQQGADGTSVGEIILDPDTGQIRYRCDGDPTGEERKLSGPAGAAGDPAASANARTAPAGSGVPAAATPQTSPASGIAVPPPRAPVPDIPEADPGTVANTPASFGADAAYINKPAGPGPTRPEDCVGIHPYYLTYPACVIAARIGLLRPVELAPEPEPDVVAPEAPIIEGPGETEDGGRRIGALPEDAADRAAQARADTQDRIDAELEAEADAAPEEEDAEQRPVGSAAEPVSGSTDWVSIVIWVGIGFGALTGLVVLLLGLITVFNRFRLKRREAEDQDDPFAAYFEADPMFDPDYEGDDMDVYDDDDDGAADDIQEEERSPRKPQRAAEGHERHTDGFGKFEEEPPDDDDVGEDEGPLFGHVNIPGTSSGAPVDDDISRSLEAALSGDDDTAEKPKEPA